MKKFAAIVLAGLLLIGMFGEPADNSVNTEDKFHNYLNSG